MAVGEVELEMEVTSSDSIKFLNEENQGEERRRGSGKWDQSWARQVLEVQATSGLTKQRARTSAYSTTH